jgi:hypothetical protein
MLFVVILISLGFSIIARQEVDAMRKFVLLSQEAALEDQADHQVCLQELSYQTEQNICISMHMTCFESAEFNAATCHERLLKCVQDLEAKTDFTYYHH